MYAIRSRDSSRKVGALATKTAFSASGIPASQAPGPKTIASANSRAPPSRSPAASRRSTGLHGAPRARERRGARARAPRAAARGPPATARELRAGGGQAQGDRGAEGVADDVRRSPGHGLDQRRHVGDVLLDAALTGRVLAPAVPPAVEPDRPEPRRQLGDERLPVPAVAPRAVDQDHGLPGPGGVDLDPQPVDRDFRHLALRPRSDVWPRRYGRGGRAGMGRMPHTDGQTRSCSAAKSDAEARVEQPIFS